MSVTHLYRNIWHLLANSARFLVHLYQRNFLLVIGSRCKYYPSCSRYADLVPEMYGLGKGLLLIGWRLMRRNPLSNGGVDYPPVRGAQKNPWHVLDSITAAAYVEGPAVCDGKFSEIPPCC